MTTLIAPDELRRPAVDAPGAPRLRVRRAGRVEQTIPLDAGKLTIGSSPRCQIRLPAEDARPLQCVISLEAGVAVATRWAAGVVLNGREFSKQELHRDDRLAIGPWEIEWDPPATESTTVRATDPGANTPASSPTLEPAIGATMLLSTTVASTPAAPPRRPSAVTKLLVLPTVPPSATPRPVTPTPAELRRPAAKTQLVASRKTDPFDQPLGPAPPPPLTEAPRIAYPPHPSQEFEDRLVVELWAANFTARSRAKALVAAARAARVRAGKLATAVEAFEVQLLAVRSAHDAESVERRNQLDALRAELIQSISDRDALDADLQQLRAVVERSAADQTVELESIRAEVQLAVDERDRASADLERVVAERDRLAGELNELRAASEQQAVELSTNLQSVRAEVQHAVAERDRVAADLEFVTAERDRLAGDLHQLRAATDRQALEQSANLEATNAELQSALAEREKLGAKLELAVAERGRLAAEFNDFRAEADRLSTEAAAALDAARREGAAAAADRDRLTADKNELRAATDRQSAQRTADLDAVRGELERAIADHERMAAELQAATTERNRVAEELESCKAALRRTPPPDPRLQALAEARSVDEGEARQLREQIDAWERRHVEWQAERQELQRNRVAVADEAAKLRDEVAASEAHIERLQEQIAAADASRAEFEQRLADQQQQQEQWLADCQTLQRNHAATLSELTAERDQLQQRLDELASQPAPQAPTAASWAAGESTAAEEPTLPTAAVEAAPDEPLAPEASFAPTSFIDRYRHLLDDEGVDADAISEPSLRHSRPILDDEYLSPAKAAAGDGDEDSDEALEAYMSNMMRRVRSSTPSVGASHAFQVVEPSAESSWSTPIPDAPAVEAIEMEVDANGMERPVRKQPITTDLSALRDLANASARTAIADYRQRLRFESTLTKAIVCAVALAAAPLLMQRATGFSSLWFWSGSAALVVAAGAGVLLVRMFWQRLFDRLRNPSAIAPAKPTRAATAIVAATLAENAVLAESLD